MVSLMRQPRRVPKVTIVIIFLDAANFLEEAIQSVLAQTYQNWELLQIDDSHERDAQPRWTGSPLMGSLIRSNSQFWYVCARTL